MDVTLAAESFGTAYTFIRRELTRNRISEEIIMETMLLFEALYNDLLEQGFDRETLLTLTMHNTFGEINIKLGFEGKPYIPVPKNPTDVSPEISILLAYDDKVDYRYSTGYNNIRIIVKRNHSINQMRCFAGILLAILVYIPLSIFVSFEERQAIEERIVFPLVKLYANAMLMVGAPVTLFSLVKNLTDTYIVSERSSSGRRLQMKAVITSFISVLLALLTSIFIAKLFDSRDGYLAKNLSLGGTMSFSEVIASLVPSSIFEPFETFMPFPLIIVALLITYAFCSAGKHFEIIKQAVDVCYNLFSKMLHVVMFALPFFCFLAILTPMLAVGIGDLLLIAELAFLIIVSIIVLFIFYLIRLLIGGVELGTFLKHLPPLILENIRINSAIDAVPFNVRYCVKKYGYNRKRLSEELTILAQTNLDGNCYLLMLLSMIFVFLMGLDISWFQILVIAILVLFLSLGAPNQPGSILIGTLIIVLYLHADDLISMAIYCEVLFGAVQNLINVLGDIVTVAIEDQKAKKVSRNL